LRPDTAILAEDETDILFFPPLRAKWAPRGATVPVSISGRNAKCVLFDAINIRTGHRLLLERPSNRIADFIAFLTHLRTCYPHSPLALLLDEHPSHTAAHSEHVAKRLNIRLVWLPHRSPELNPMDHLWRFAKQAISANHQHKSIEEHLYAFVLYVYQLTNADARCKAGLQSKKHWLRKIMSRFLWQLT
jgi:transposase